MTDYAGRKCCPTKGSLALGPGLAGSRRRSTPYRLRGGDVPSGGETAERSLDLVGIGTDVA